MCMLVAQSCPYLLHLLHWQVDSFTTAPMHVFKVKVLVTRSCPTLCDPMDCSLPGSSAHGISQARILEWVAIPFSRGSSWPRGQTWVFFIAGRFFTIWVTRKARSIYGIINKKKPNRVVWGMRGREERRSKKGQVILVARWHNSTTNLCTFKDGGA